MNWRSFWIRLVLVLVAFPVLGLLIFGLPHPHHLAFNALVVAATVAGALEMSSLFRARGIPTSAVLAPCLSAVFPLATYLQVSRCLTPPWVGVVVTAALAVVLVRSVLFPVDRSLGSVLAFTSSSLFTLFYPGFFLSWVVRFSALPQPSLSILYFLCLVFGNDMAAYLAGSLWGSSSRLNLVVSPMKSALGFAAGMLGSLVVVGLFQIAQPQFPPFGLPAKILLGLGTGVTVIVGDLLESGLKRCARVKDSGGMIPGRGGILDSVDSMVFTAPLFYYVLSLAAG